MTVKLKVPHIHEKPLKHTVGFNIVVGTILEAAHILYPSGLIMLGCAAIIAVYEPYLVHKVKEIHMEDETEI